MSDNHRDARAGAVQALPAEELVIRRDPRSGLVGVIAVHSTALGPAAGGCRRWHYVSEQAAIEDASRLAESMTLKNALADIPFGGGKSVILSDGQTRPDAQQLETFAGWLNDLQGRYITAEDVGMGVAQMQTLAQFTPYVSGLGRDGVGGDPSPKTAFGVYLGLKHLVKLHLGREHLYGLRVAVQGLGQVGLSLVHWLARAGADITVADVSTQRVQMAVHRYEVRVVSCDEITQVESDVFAPCALGGVITPELARTLPTSIVAGAANNQLSAPLAGELLAQRGIVYAPDFVINAGGVISIACEYLRQSGAACAELAEVGAEAWVARRIDAIPQRLAHIVAQAQTEGRATEAVARERALDVIAGRALPGHMDPGVSEKVSESGVHHAA